MYYYFLKIIPSLQCRVAQTIIYESLFKMDVSKELPLKLPNAIIFFMIHQ